MISRQVLRWTLLCGFLATGCAHYPDVRPSADGTHLVSFLTERKDQGFQPAFSQAKDYCDDVHKMRAVQVGDKSEYVGNMSESTYNAAKTTSEVVEAIGGAGILLGGKNEKKAGGVVGIGGGIADSALGQGYRYSMTFKCQ